MPLNMCVCGLEYMNDDPNNVDVLYAKLDEGPNLDRYVNSFNTKYM